MTLVAPTLAPEYELDRPIRVDIDAVIAPILRRATESPVLQGATPEALFSQVPARMPRQGVDLDTALDELDAVAVRHGRRNAHPGFFGYVAGPGLPTDPLGHALTAALNQNTIGFPGAPGPTTIERTVINWLRQLTGLPDTADGAICSGGSIANLSALTAALYGALGNDILRTGLAAWEGPRPVFVAASTAHFSIDRAAVVLGLGADQVIQVECDARYRMRPERLEQVLACCASENLLPVCVVANAGATISGSIDPLDEIAEVCARAGVWMHVDAAYGGAGLLSETLRPKFQGIERADSVCMDLHKWFYLAFDGSLILYRDPEAARNVFYTQSDYVRFAREASLDEHMFFHFSPELSRRFRALPAYLAFRYYGSERLGRNVLHNYECAAYLAALVEAEPDMELICPPDLSICCFRYRPGSLADDPDTVGRINERIRAELQKQGDFLLSSTAVDGQSILRVCICSHTTRAYHMQALVDSVRSLGEKICRFDTRN